MSSPSLAGEFLHHPVPPIDCRLEGSSTKTCVRCETGRGSSNGGRCQVTIDILPDVALLEIFDCFVNQAREEEEDWPPTQIEAWHTLVHVCRTWRTIVLGSPHRLALRLLCLDKTPVKETLAVWPPLPIVIVQVDQPTQMDNTILALEHNDRVCRIDLDVPEFEQLEEFLAAMQQPFPALTKLALRYGVWLEDGDEMIEMPVIPESFLGGSAPRLQRLLLDHVPFPGLPKLLLSATDLVSLSIWKIPHSGYISPEAMVRCLTTLTRLESLEIGFKSPRSGPVRESRRPHPPTRSALPTLTYFEFEGVSEYLEDFVAGIDAPLLDDLRITFFHQLIFDTPQLVQFFARTPNIQPAVEAGIVFFSHKPVRLAAVVPGTGVQLVLARGFHSKDDIEDSQWLEVLQPFTALKDLYVSTEFLPRFAPAFQELAGEHVTDMLPALQSLFFEERHPSGPVWEAIEKFVAARQLAGHPIAVSHWDGLADGERLVGRWR
ncbi:hypothetical protein V8E52_005799 [Russula decolorans]